MNRFAAFLLLYGCLVELSAARAEADPSEDESAAELAPGDTAFGQEAGEYEITLEASRIEGPDEVERGVLLGFEYGLTERLQLEAEVPYVFVEAKEEDEQDRDGFDAATVGLQVALLPPGAVAFSAAFEAAFPLSGEDGPGTTDHEQSAALLAAWVRGETELFGGVTATWTPGPTELEAEIGAVFVTGRYATEIALTWLDDGEDVSWEVRPELIIEDLGPIDLGIGLPYVFQDGGDEWGVELAVIDGA